MASILVIHYSRSGNTQKVAQAIARACGADLEQIRDVKPRHGLWGWIRSGREAMRAIPAEIRPLKRDPANAIAQLDLTADERSALLCGDVARLYEWGCHPFLLAYLPRWELFGLTIPLYSERIRKARDQRDETA